MTNLLKIKPYIHNFVENNLDSSFDGKVYWIGERKNVPEYPYCLLNAIAENKDKRTSHHIGSLNENDTRKNITTRYKTCTITVGVYNGWTDECDTDMDDVKEFTYEQIDYLEGAFEDYPINNRFSIQSISPIRPLHEAVAGGYLYRYEFDLTIGYNEARISEKDVAKNIEAEVDNSGDKIHFNIELVNDTVIIKDLI